MSCGFLPSASVRGVIRPQLGSLRRRNGCTSSRHHTFEPHSSEGKRPSPSTHQQCPGLHWDSTSQVPSPPGRTPSQENTSHCLALPMGAALGTCYRRMGDGDWRLGAAGPLYGGSLSSHRPVSPGWGWRTVGNLCRPSARKPLAQPVRLVEPPRPHEPPSRLTSPFPPPNPRLPDKTVCIRSAIVSTGHAGFPSLSRLLGPHVIWCIHSHLWEKRVNYFLLPESPACWPSWDHVT